MSIDINLWAVLVCVVLSIIFGAIWYGPLLFGKKWMEIIGLKDMTEEQKKQMQKSSMSLYLVQFLLSFMQIYFLAYYVNIFSWIDISGITNALMIWVAFIVPTIAGGVMWNNNPNKIKWSMFSIQAGYQLIVFVVSGYILCIWK